MKRSITALRFFSVSALATSTRMVCPRTSVASVALATMWILPSSISFRPNGGEAQPTSTWSVITVVSVEVGLPVACGLGVGQLEFVDEGAHDAVGRGAVARIGDGLAVGVLERLDRRVLGIPVVGGAGRLRADDAHRRALRIGRHGAERADRETQIDAAGDHRLQRLAAARGVDHLELEAVLLEDAGLGRRDAVMAVSQLPRWPMVIFRTSSAAAGEARAIAPAVTTPANVWKCFMARFPV